MPYLQVLCIGGGEQVTTTLLNKNIKSLFITTKVEIGFARVCVCVCVWERERERGNIYIYIFIYIAFSSFFHGRLIQCTLTTRRLKSLPPAERPKRRDFAVFEIHFNQPVKGQYVTLVHT